MLSCVIILAKRIYGILQGTYVAYKVMSYLCLLGFPVWSSYYHAVGSSHCQGILKIHVMLHLSGVGTVFVIWVELKVSAISYTY